PLYYVQTQPPSLSRQSHRCHPLHTAVQQRAGRTATLALPFYLPVFAGQHSYERTFEPRFKLCRCHFDLPLAQSLGHRRSRREIQLPASDRVEGNLLRTPPSCGRLPDAPQPLQCAGEGVLELGIGLILFGYQRGDVPAAEGSFPRLLATTGPRSVLR
ncbi:unnamed protein product, partial [Ectocarpus fasciculatus]